MLLREMFLSETTEDEQFIIALSARVSQYLRTNFPEVDEEPVTIGNVGKLFNPELEQLSPITLKVAPSEYLRVTYAPEIEPDKIVGGVWDPESESVFIAVERINTTRAPRILAHEFRHALDDYSSNFKAGIKRNRYDVPKKQEHRNAEKDPYAGHIYYQAKPAEINARFSEVLTDLQMRLDKSKTTSKPEMRKIMMNQLHLSMDKRKISYLFPERTENRDFQRLLSRAADYIDKGIDAKLAKSNTKLT